jgi:hypothetical protein
VTDEVQVRTVDAHHAVRTRSKSASIKPDLRSEHAKRGTISRGQDHSIEWLFGTVDEAHALWRELLQPSPQLNASTFDAIRQMESDEGNRSAGIIGWRR